MAVNVTWTASSSEGWGDSYTATLTKSSQRKDLAKITIVEDEYGVGRVVRLTKTELLELAATAQALAAGMED